MADTNRHPLVSHQPLKLLFQLAYITTIVARLPFWLAVAFSQRLRPHPDWTAKQTIMARIAYVSLDMKSRIGITDKLSLRRGKEGDRFQVVEPSALDIYQGPMLSEVKPVPVGGTWFPEAPGKDITSRIVVLYLHGGAFVEGDGRDGQCGFPGNTMVERGGADSVFSLQYRLSGWGGLSPFPAALQDALTGYLFLLHKVGVPSRQIVLCGDSSGGNIVIALLRYIQDFGANLDIPTPRCATLLSPWVAPSEYDTDSNPRRNSDYLPTSFLRWGAQTYTGDRPNASADPYITPLGNPFATRVPLFVNACTTEIFFDSFQTWVEEMKQITGNRVELHEEVAALHDSFLVAEVLGFEDSAREVISAMGAFIRRF